MRVLLDENLDWWLIRYFDADFQVTTVSQQGWKGMRNGELLRQAAATFDALITMDKGIEHQQNLRRRRTHRHRPYIAGTLIVLGKNLETLIGN